MRRAPEAIARRVEGTNFHQVRQERQEVPAAQAVRVLEKHQVLAVIAVEDTHVVASAEPGTELKRKRRTA
jgi:hypothetical protein